MAKRKSSKSQTKSKAASAKSKRRPSVADFDEVEEVLMVSTDVQSNGEEVFEPASSARAESETAADNMRESFGDQSQTEAEGEKRRLQFYGSDVLREKAPQAFELAEAVANEWAHDGNFQKLPINSPLGQLVAAISLQSAKRIEKKLEEKGVINMAKMSYEYAKTRWPFRESKNESI